MKQTRIIARLCTLLLAFVLVTSPITKADELVRIGIIPLNYGEFKELQIYASGTQDTLINALQTIPELVVIDRTRTSDVLKELAFQQTAFVDPNFANPYKNRGFSYENKGDCSKANQDYKKACSLGFSEACSWVCK